MSFGKPGRPGMANPGLSDTPRTLPQLLDYIERYADTIFVRELVNGNWESVALSSLPAKRALFHGFRFLRDGVIPVQVRDAEEDGDAG